MQQKRGTGFYYGYWIAVAGLLFSLIFSGVGFYAFGIFFKPIQEEFAWSRGVTSVAFTLLYAVQAIASPVIGKLTDRLGPKKVIILGAVITSLGLALLSFTNNLTFFYTAYAFTGLGLSAISMIPVSAAVSNWFVEKRGLAIGIAAAGVGVGGLTLSPIIGDFLIPVLGWRKTYQVLALFSGAFIITIAQLVLKTRPYERAEQRDSGLSEAGDGGAGPVNPVEGWRLNEALHSSTFWLIVGAFILSNIGQVGTIQHLVNHFTDIGFSTTIAVGTVSLIGLGSTMGKFFFGYLSDRLELKYCTVISFLLELIATVVLIMITPLSHPAMRWAFALILGVGIGGWAPLTAVLTSHNFGLAYYGAIYGAVSLFHNISTGMGPIFFGYVFDVMQGYYWALISSIVFYSTAIGLILAMRRPKPAPTNR